MGRDDTYGDARQTGGDSTGRGTEYGMGSGRGGAQETGGIGSELGGSGRGGDNYDDSGRSGKDSKLGKVMEKAGGAFKSDKLMDKGREKRDAAGGYDNDNYGASGQGNNY